MIRARLLVIPVAVMVVLAALTACTPNVVNGAQSWLNGQDGVASASIVVDRTTLYGSSGVVRGELDDGIDGARLDLLVDRVAGYVADNPGTEMRLGVGDVDFVVDGSSTDAAREQWGELTQLDGLVAALASGDGGVRVHVLRPELREVLEALESLPGAVEVEAFRTAEAEEQDRRDDDYGPPQRSIGSLQFLWGGACAPSVDQWSRLMVTAGSDAIDEGAVDACGGYHLVYREQTDLTAVAAEWAQVQAIATDPVPTLTVAEDGAGYHEIAVTPGDPSLFPVVAAFEAPDAPVVQYWLDAEGALVLKGWENPAGELLDLLAASPLAPRLTSISLEGDIDGPVGGESVTAIGTLAELGTLVADAEQLIALDGSFYQVAIEPTAVSIDLYSPPGTDPDMAAAAAALRTSPIWTTRDTYVNYLNGVVVIHEGIASLGAESYTDQQPYDDFIAAWNGAASP
jgi:hypothetical protein